MLEIEYLFNSDDDDIKKYTALSEWEEFFKLIIQYVNLNSDELLDNCNVLFDRVIFILSHVLESIDEFNNLSTLFLIHSQKVVQVAMIVYEYVRY